MFRGRFTKDGGMEFGTYTRNDLKKFIKKNPGMPFEIKPLMPESIKQRGFFEACLCPLVTFFQEGMDHHNSDDVQKVREWLKLEFNSEMVEVGGKIHKIAQSTKKKLNQGMLEKIVGYLEENYAPPSEALDPEFYKDWRDRIYPYGGPDNIIDYLISLNILTQNEVTSKDSEKK
jgi:hypothetical protein